MLGPTIHHNHKNHRRCSNATRLYLLIGKFIIIELGCKETPIVTFSQRVYCLQGHNISTTLTVRETAAGAKADVDARHKTDEIAEANFMVQDLGCRILMLLFSQVRDSYYGASEAPQQELLSQSMMWIFFGGFFVATPKKSDDDLRMCDGIQVIRYP